MTTRALILVAAGRGERAGGNIPKQYRALNGKPLLQHTIDNAQILGAFDETVLVIAADDERATQLTGSFRIVTGGANRTASVRAGLAALEDNPPAQVFIHDGARPFLDDILVSPLIDALETVDGAVPALPISDAIKSIEFEPVNRDTLRRVQTPQAFDYAKIKAAFDALPAGASTHDDIEVAKAAGLTLAFTPGLERNIKVTYPEDFARAEAMLTDDKSVSDYAFISGSGFDVHRLEKSEEPLWLCGVEIPSELTLVGHSDADVGLHAITDAILGAIACGDIGDHFPPSDPKWRGAASDQFLRHAIELAAERRASLVHIDLTLICERPKVKRHREAMRARMAEISGLPPARVSLKATTTEGLGFTGRGEGIAAQAIVTMRVPL